VSAFVRTPPLIGRDAELATLRHLVREAVAGHGHLVWLEGEPGIGKSMLLAGGLDGAERLGCRLFLLAADELAQRFPLRVVLDGLHATPGSADPDLRVIAELARGELASGGAAADPVPAMSEHLLAMLDRWCSQTPVVLAMDDIQYADEASLMVWHRLGRAARQLPLLLVIAARPVPRRADVAQLRRALLAAGATFLALGPLTPAQVGRLAGDLTGAATVGPTLRRALEQAAGNPLYVHEMIDALSRDGRISSERGTADLTGPGTGLPRSMAAATASRLGFVSDPTMDVLRSAALLGVAFSVTDLAAVTDRTVPELAPAIDEGVAAGLLVESGSRLAFRHGLIREALHNQTPSALRLALHGHAARALDRAGAAAEDVARQLLAAMPPDEPTAAPQEWVVDWLIRAGRALAYRSPQVTADLLDHAVRHLPPEDQRRESLQVILATVLVLLGRSDESAALAERVLAASPIPEHVAELTSNLAFSHAMGGRYDQAREVLRHALRAPDLDIDRSARLRAVHARVLLMTDDPRTVETAERALAEARLAGDRYAAATAMHAIALAGHYHRGDAAGGLELLDRALAEVGDDAQSTDLRLVLLFNRVNMLDALGRVADSESATHELLRAAEHTAAPPRLATIRLGAAAHHYFRGRWDDALAEVEATADEQDRLAHRNRMWQHGIPTLIAVHRDGPLGADDVLELDRQLAGPMIPGVEYPLLARAALAERDGDPRRAVAILRRWFEPVDHVGTRDVWLPELVRLALATGDRGFAAGVAEVCDVDLTEPTGRSQRAAAQRCRGLVDADAGLLLAAAGTHRDDGHTVELAHTLEDAAVVLAGHDDRAAARAAYAEAAGHYVALGATWDLRRADARLRPLGLRRQRAPRRRAVTGWAALTPTELDVARLVADGLPNPDIAARLFSSRRTVEVHVSRILTKLEVRSRIEIAREATLHAG